MGDEKQRFVLYMCFERIKSVDVAGPVVGHFQAKLINKWRRNRRNCNSEVASVCRTPGLD